jgi:hypothetical protein
LFKNLKGHTNIQSTGRSNDESEEEVKYDKNEVVVKQKDHILIRAFSPRSNIKIKNTNARIESDLIKRLELDHIEEMIDGMSVHPDFGFPYIGSYEEGADTKGWRIVKDFVEAGYKYERLENFIKAVHLEREAPKKAEKDNKTADADPSADKKTVKERSSVDRRM